MKTENDLIKAAVTMTACVVMGIGANSAQAVVIGQDDFDGNRNFVSFSQTPSGPAEQFDAFDIISYESVVASDRNVLLTGIGTDSPMSPAVDGQAFWVANLSSPPGVLTWVFDTSGHENLRLAFDLAGVADFGFNSPNEFVVRAGFDDQPLVTLGQATLTPSGTMVLGGVDLGTDTLPKQIDFDIAGSGDRLTVEMRIGGEVSTVVQFGFTEQLVIDDVSLISVPEPGSLALLGLSGVAMLVRRRNRRHA